jgi:hypothetical protein
MKCLYKFVIWLLDIFPRLSFLWHDFVYRVINDIYIVKLIILFSFMASGFWVIDGKVFLELVCFHFYMLISD